jgi:hypothetical protein
MPRAYEAHPDDVTMACPDWARWLGNQRAAVECRACRCVFTARRWEPVWSAELAKFLGHPGAEREGGYWGGGVPPACTSCEYARREAARKALPPDPALVAAVRAHAVAHYADEKGWDFVVESYTDAELWEVIAGSESPAAAVAAAAEVAELLHDRRKDAGGW